MKPATYPLAALFAWVIQFSLLLSAPTFGAEIARWDAAKSETATGIQLERATDLEWQIEPVEGRAVARLKPSGDYYTRTVFKLAVPPQKQKAWLVVEFVDNGYGLLSLMPPISPTNQWGVARVNSHTVRRAVFGLEAPTPPQLTLKGLDCLCSVMLVDAPPPLEEVPSVKPAVNFSRYSERVTAGTGDYGDPSHLAEALAGLRNQLPFVQAMGFNGVEMFVRWGFVETRPGHFDWSYFDAAVAEIQKHGLKWFPMLLAGSGYALPAWFHDSTNNFGFKCLEHGIVHDTQSIFHPHQREYAQRFIAEFGKHYGQCQSLLGIRLGPSGDFGEAQYPAKGPGYGFRKSHTHIGYWAGDDCAQQDFRLFLKQKYGDLDRLNAAWENSFSSFDQIKTFLPATALTRRQRVDFADWYVGAMSHWCEQWAVWSREALPQSVIHQSSGGWGPVEIGTDYSYQAKSMSKVHGGLRLTNEGDDFPDNFTITRMASSAARFYGVPLGSEPGGFGSKRGVMARLFNAITSDAVHLFYYLGNLTDNDYALEAWLKYAPLLDQRAKPLIDVAAFYPDSCVKLDDETVRYRWASTFYTVARTLRETVDFDYASEQMVLDGALERYRVLLFLWGAITEKPVLEGIDRWVRNGGTLVFATRPRGLPQTVEADTGIAEKWLRGDTGKGRVIQWSGDLIPSRSYAEFVRNLLLPMPGIQAPIQDALRMEKPASVFWSVLENGQLALLNFSDHPASVRLVDGRQLTIAPYEIAMAPTTQRR